MRVHKDPCPDYGTDDCSLEHETHCDRDICCPYEDEIISICCNCGAKGG